jgi:hypothetical protein
MYDKITAQSRSGRVFDGEGLTDGQSDVYPDLNLTAGDDWAIIGNLLDTNGQPLDLTSATLGGTCGR